LARQVLTFDLDDETEALRREHGWRDNGHSAKTLVKHHDQRIVLIAMKQGARMMKHKASGAVSIHVLSGGVRIDLGETTVEVPAGQLLALEGGLPHDVEATLDSSVLLSLSFTARTRSAIRGPRSK
jgi:quercetin dioxygenase-like cupin family protein